MNVYEPLMDPVALTVFILTLILPVLVGFIALKRTRDQTDFFIGGRGMGKVVIALSAVSSGRSSWLVLGVSGMAYTLGAGAVWAVAGYIVVELLQFIFIGQRLRTQTGSMESLTLLDYLESRFQDKTHWIRLTGAVILILFLTAYVAAQLNAGAKSLSTALNMPLVASLGTSALLILIYMVLGGFIAVAYNDVVRAIIMIIGLVFFPGYVLIKSGGVGVVMSSLKALNPSLVNPFALGAGVIIGFLGIGLGSPGQPHILVRYMAIKDASQLRWSAIIGTFWNIVMAWGALFIGLLGRYTFPTVASLPDKDPEMIYLALSSGTFGPAIYGLLIGGIFAAILSTADSQLLVVASTVVRDLYEKVIYKRRLSEDVKLKLSRWVVVLSGLVAMVLAYSAKDIIFWLVLFAWGGLGASFGPAIIMSLYWKGTTRGGVVAGMMTGTIVTIVWKLFLKSSTGIYELIPAFGMALVVIWIVSLAVKSRE